MNETMPLLLSSAEAAFFRIHCIGTILEFGMGGSTILAASLGAKRIISVDSDPAWRDRVADELKTTKAQCRVDLICCDIGPIGEFGMPVEPSRIARWPQYYIAPWAALKAELPNLIYVDGRFRVACALYSALQFNDFSPKLLIHDFERDCYHRLLAYFEVKDRVERLASLALKPRANIGEMVSDLLQFQFDPR
jgi:hypothetical protein